MSFFAKTILEQKYLWKEKGEKDWSDVTKRVAKNVFKSVDLFLSDDLVKEFIKIMNERKFIPGGRYLHSSGRPYHQTQNCLLLKVEDSREAWGELLNKVCVGLSTGAGLGVDYSDLRPEGKLIRKTGGTATGPIHLMRMTNEVGRGIMAGGSRRCLPKGSLVHTYEGLEPIESVQPGTMVLTKNGYHKVLNNFTQGIQDLIEIQTDIGSLKCTPNHKIAVLTSVRGDYIWKEAKDLNSGDRLLQTSDSLPGIKTTLPRSNYIRSPYAYTVKEITIPELDDKMAWFIGYFHANGHSAIRYQKDNLSKRNSVVSIAIPKDAPQIKNECMTQLIRFGVNPRVTDGDGECWNVKCASVPLAEWIQENIKTSNTTMDIPKFILQGTEHIRAAYIAGMLDGDGGVTHRPVIITNTVYPEYALQLQALCSSLGITTKFFLNRPARGNWKPLYRVILKGTKQVSRFLDTCGKHLIYKNFEDKIRTKEQHSYSFPPEMVRSSDIDKSTLHKNFSVNYPCERIEAIIGKQNFTPITVIDIVNSDSDETYDIEVEERNEFYCNGYLVHNSAIWAGLNWKHQDIYKFIHSKNWSEDVRKLKAKDFNFPAQLDGTNISVLLDDDFFKAYHDEKHILHTQAQQVYWETTKQMLKTAEPGFSVDIGQNAGETLRNACCELTSRDDSDICNLGSINMARIESLEEMKRVTEVATAFLLAGTVYSDVPYAKVDQVRTKNRRLGLGLMGVHEWLLKNGKKYGPDQDLQKYLEIYESNTKIAHKYADKWDLSRPVKTRAIAPTGSLGILAETTTGIEPIFCVAYKRRYLKHETWNYQYVIDPTAKRLIDQGINPDHIEDAYSLAENVERRVEFQAWLQKYVDHAISSTINLPSWGSELNNDNKVQDFGNMLIKHLPNLRGVTTYPDGARDGQPLVPVKYNTAIKNIGEVFEESVDICDITGKGSC